MLERSVVTRFDAKVDGYLAGVAKMQTATVSLAKQTVASATKNKTEWNNVAKASVIGGAAIGLAVLGAAKAYMQFEAAMSGVAAVADATAKQQRELSKAAIQAGQDTVFSATEAAQAEAELAKAGVSVTDILGGGLKGSLDLAAAGQIGLAESATIAAQAMNIFDKSGKDVGHIADVLTAGANKSAAGVDDLGMALQQSGLVAKQTGLSLEDTVGVLSAFADNALRGSDAGTSLKTMLQRLTPQSAEAQAQFDKLGISAYDAQGNFVGLENFAGQLQTRLSGLTPEARNSALAVMFGSDAVRGANVLYEQGAEGIRKYIAAVDDQGAAARMAAKQTDNLKGDLEQLKGTLESAFINGGQGGNEGLRSLVQTLTDAVDKFNQLSPATQSYIVKVAAVAAGSLLLFAATTKVVTGLATLRTAYATTGIAGTRFAGTMGTATKGAGKLAAAFTAMALASQAFGGTDDLGVHQLANDMRVATDPIKALNDELERTSVVAGTADFPVRNIGDALKESFNPGAYNNVQKVFGAVGGFFGGDFKTDSEFASIQLDKVGQSLGDMVANGQGAKAADIFREISVQAKAQGISTGDLIRKMPAYQEALDAAAVAAAGAAGPASTLADSIEQTSAAAADAKASVDDYVKSLIDSGLVVLSRRDAERQLRDAMSEVKGQIDKNGHSLDEKTEKGRENAKFLDDLAQKHLNVSQAIYDETGSEEQFRASQVKSRAELIKTYLRFDNNQKRAEAYADSIVKIPPAKNTKVTLTTAGFSQLKAVGDYLKGLHDKNIKLTVGTIRVGNTKVNAGQYADGGPAIGAGTATSDSIPALLSNGEHVLTAKEVERAGGHDAIYRWRRSINAGALKFAAGGAVGPAKFAEGGEVDWSSIMDLIGDVTTWDDVAKARGTAASRAAAVKSARASLASLRSQLAHTKALDKRRVLLAKVAAAEDRLSVSMSKSTAAARAAKAAVDEYDRDRRPLLDRTLAASSKSNTSTKAFLDNIDKLTRMGFKTLALALLDQGGPEAETLAAQAVKSASKAKQLQSYFTSSAALADRAAATRAALTGQSLSAVTPELGWYGQVRDLGPIARPSASGYGVAPVVTNVNVNITGPVDKMAAGREIVDVLQQYTATTGKPLQVQVSG